MCTPDAVYVYLGQKTAIVGNAPVTVVAEVLSSDRTNVRDGEKVTFVLQRAAATVRVASQTKDGIAHAALDIGTVSGPAYVWVETAGVQSEKQSLVIMAGEPASFSLSVLGCSGGVSCTVESTDIRDAFGNRVPDGIAGTLKAFSGDNLLSQQTVYTLRGTVEANWALPERGARVELMFGAGTVSREARAR